MLGVHSLLAQGPLTPPGAPAPTMKTLDQVEPRIDVQNAPSSAVTTSNANYHYIINQPGSYYLSANIGVTKTHGIQINAAGVTLDLNGFEIARSSGTGGNGIEIVASAPRASVHNGSIRSFAYGIRSLFLITSPRGSLFRDITVSNCTTYGIYAGEGAVLEGCRAVGNSGTASLHGDPGSTFINCTAVSNSATSAIDAGAGSTLSNCTAYFNSGTAGIKTGDGSSLSNCAANLNTVQRAIHAGNGCSLTNCSASNNTGIYGIASGTGCALLNCSAYSNIGNAGNPGGIQVGNHSTAVQCTSSFNTNTGSQAAAGFYLFSFTTIRNSSACENQGNGIELFGDSVVEGNVVEANGEAGIYFAGLRNRIVGNSATNNGTGIFTNFSGNFIARNTVSGNTNNWSVASGNVILVISATTAGSVIGNSGGAAPGSTDPNANFTY